ncbi:uncharacterized protein LOC122979391 isoform X2 [Thunnus albacares]|uniref:uncharacterized protein LOC122979391 isoform X2 n=1 Tax=Thunnus albacares TaxID=8236 RepID=UPI001CF70338|nr:uncharacterized protein LOC122979391 isoform X2 [Thunnus albacares]
MTFGQMKGQCCDYYLRHSESRPQSPLSTLSDVEYLGLCLEESFEDNRPDSPDSVSSQDKAEKHSVTVFASQPHPGIRFLTYADVVRGSTHESVASVTDHRSLSPDSPILQFKSPHISYDVELSRYRSFTPDSTISDWEGTDLCLESLFVQTRPESPQSDSSDFELDKFFSSRALSPDSPVPQFISRHIANDVEFLRYRSFTPESTISDWESADLCLETLFDQTRPESPQSDSSDFELEKFFSSRALSPDSPIPQFRLPHIEYDGELSRYRSFTPESSISDWEGTDLCLETLFDQTRSESPQSVLSEFELDKFFSSRALSPESVSSDFDFSLLQDWLVDFRPSSPESVASVEQHSFSPHMTFGQMKGQCCDYYLRHSESRPQSPLSTLSDVEYLGLCLEESFEDNRPDSPDSVSSQDKAEKHSVTVFASQPHPGIRFLTYADVVRGSTHESVASVTDHRSLSPDSPILQFKSPHISYDVELSRYRSFTPDSTISDWEGTDLCLESLFVQTRPESPQSDSSDFELDKFFSSRALSPDSPVPQFISRHIANDVEFLRYRSFTPESTISDWESADLCLETLFDQTRPESPQSDSSDFELEKFFSSRALSPDSPIPQFRLPHIGYDGELSRYRSFTPESSISDWEGTDLCLETLFDQTRSESPQSVLSEFELDKFFSSRALSPESVSSDFDFSLLQDWLVDFRPSSPESVASVEQHSFSPHMTFGQMKGQCCDYYLRHSESRPQSPLSTLSDVEYLGLCLEESFEDNRPDSPDSVSSHDKDEAQGVTVFEFRRHPGTRFLTYADVVRSTRHESVPFQIDHRSLSPDSPIQFKSPHISYNVELSRYRPFSPESTISDWEGTDLCLETLFDQTRPESPQSDSSDFELEKFFSSRALSPDSPIPQFRLPHIGYDGELSRYRSFTPESSISDWEGTDLCLETLFDQTRSESPQSVLSEFELDKFFSSRALSPESVSSDFDFSLLQDWLVDFRPSSPESVASVEQHSFSPHMTFGQMKGQCCDYYLRHSESRPQSPLSTLSDVEYLGLCLEESFEDNRPDSPDSVSSHDKDEAQGVTVFEFRRHPGTRFLTYADVVRSTRHESVPFQIDHRSLSPDSPIQFKSPHISYNVELSRYRPFSPESTISDWEGTDLCLETLFDQTRPESPQSDSSDFELEKFFSSRALSPDSPIPQFRLPHIGYDGELSRYRSFTPESSISDWEGTDLCLETLFDQTRSESPQSVLSEFELDKFFSSRALSPESVSSDFDFSLLQDWLVDFRPSSPESVASVEQHSFSPHMTFGQMKGQCCDYYLRHSESRPQSPLSTLSDVEYLGLCLEESFEDNRPDSPDSVSSQDKAEKHSVTVFASQPHPGIRFLTYADVVRGSTHESVASVTDHRSLSPDSPILQFKSPHISYDVELSRYRSFTPDSTISDWEGTDLCLESLFVQTRPESPQSDSSDFELDKFFSSRALSPDSPIPQFRLPHIGYDGELSRYRSFTPESSISDWEGTDLCLETLFDQTRSESPQSVLSEFELEKFFSSRALSPESVSSDFDFSLLQDWLVDLRPSSPESVASVEQHSFSPHMTFGQMKDQRCDYYLQYSENRPQSPFTTLSDVENLGFSVEEFFEDNRPGSPDLDYSQDKAKMDSLTISSSEPLPDVRFFTHVELMQGSAHEKQTHASSSLNYLKPFSDENLHSTTYTKEYTVRHKPFLNHLISHVYDPVYKGKGSCCKIFSDIKSQSTH